MVKLLTVFHGDCMKSAEFHNFIVFSLCIEDFEAILNRRVSQSEAELIKSKFNIHDWTEHVEEFLNQHGIEKLKTFKFSELSKEAQEKAIKDYMDGWLETHPDDVMPRDEANETLAYAFEHDFDINGNYLGES
jgi:hypothetical protein